MMAVYAGRINWAGNNHDVLVAVVIKINKSRAPFHILHGSSKPGLNGNVGEETLPVIVKERRRLIGKIRFQDVESSITVVIACVNSHACLGMAIAVIRHAS